MTNELRPGQELDVQDVEARFPNRRLIAEYGWGAWKAELYLLPELGVYLDKGAIGTHDSVCYKVCDFKDEAGVRKWKSIQEAYWSRMKRPT